MANEVDILIVGAGPAGLAAAIKICEQARASGRAVSVAVVDKSPKPGYHCLSGANFEIDCLDELLPGWRDEHSDFVRQVLGQKVARHDTYFLTRTRALHIPSLLVPGTSRKDRNCTISIADLVAWMADKATSMGAEVYCGFSAKEPVIENGAVKGVVLRERGVDRDGNHKGNYLAPETVRAEVTILADGVCGPVSSRVIEMFELDRDRNPQVFSIGL